MWPCAYVCASPGFPPCRHLKCTWNIRVHSMSHSDRIQRLFPFVVIAIILFIGSRAVTGWSGLFLSASSQSNQMESGVTAAKNDTFNPIVMCNVRRWRKRERQKGTPEETENIAKKTDIFRSRVDTSHGRCIRSSLRNQNDEGRHCHTQ